MWNFWNLYNFCQNLISDMKIDHNKSWVILSPDLISTQSKRIPYEILEEDLSEKTIKRVLFNKFIER